MGKKYKLGYCSIVGNFFDQETYAQMKACSELCENFVIGIADEYIRARIYGDSEYSAEKMKQIWMDCKWVSDVVILHVDKLPKQNIYKELNFDVCFYGSEYGITYEEDRKFMEENGIDFLPLIPDHVQLTDPANDALRMALNNVRPEQKIVLLGTGEYFDYYMMTYGMNYAPAYAVDLAEEKWNTVMDGVMIKPPSALQDELPEDVFIVLCSGEYRSMPEQIKKMGTYDYRTFFIWNETALLDEFALAWEGEQEYLSKVQDIMLKLLQEFIRVCTKYNLRYYLMCGSLLGTIRHRGFIPWDDDLDVVMTREEYEKLKKIALKEWNTDEFLFLKPDELGDSTFVDFMPRLYYLKEKLLFRVSDKAGNRNIVDVRRRTWLDIYVLYRASDSDKRHMFYMNMLEMVYGLCMGHRGEINYSEYERRLSSWEIFMLRTAHTIGRCIPLKMLFALYERLAQYAGKEECENYYIPDMPIVFIERRFKQSYFRDGIMKKFYDFEVRVPTDYDGLLTDMYHSNYMSFPRMSARKPLHYFNSDYDFW